MYNKNVAELADQGVLEGVIGVTGAAEVKLIDRAGARTPSAALVLSRYESSQPIFPGWGCRGAVYRSPAQFLLYNVVNISGWFYLFCTCHPLDCIRDI